MNLINCLFLYLFESIICAVNGSINCPENYYSPCCATNGKSNQTFNNRCELYARNWMKASNEASFTILYNDTCVESIPCPDSCHGLESVPLCTVNRITGRLRTFKNVCQLDRENCKAKDGYKYLVVFRGACETLNTSQVCSIDNPIPVCAINSSSYRTFGSFCDLDTYNKFNKSKDESNYIFLYNGTCEGVRCPVYCGYNYRPVCACNGTVDLTFANLCELDTINCNNINKPLFKIISNGTCNLKSSCPNCSSNYDPLCISNGKESMSVGSTCQLQSLNYCSRSTEKSFYSVLYRGTCEYETCPEVCPPIFDPVCGTNTTVNKTFASKCDMRNYNCLNTKGQANFTLLYDDACKNTSHCDVFDCDNSTMPPVCATNGYGYQTFDNDCQKDYLNNCILGPNEKTFVTIFYGTCDKPRCPLQCGDIYSSVCGGNGTWNETFYNYCSMKSVNCNITRDGGSEFKLMYNGTCTGQDCSGPCSKLWAPVCAENGTDRRTFDNQCILNQYNCYNPPTEEDYQLISNNPCQPSNPTPEC